MTVEAKLFFSNFFSFYILYKKYVQDMLKEEAFDICEMLTKQASPLLRVRWCENGRWCLQDSPGNLNTPCWSFVRFNCFCELDVAAL